MRNRGAGGGWGGAEGRGRDGRVAAPEAWETLRPRSRAPAPSRSPPPCLTHPPGRQSPGPPGAPPPSLHTHPPTRVLLPPAGLAASRASLRSQALLTHTQAHARSRGGPLLSTLLFLSSLTPPWEED